MDSGSSNSQPNGGPILSAPGIGNLIGGFFRRLLPDDGM